jgi:hypothetical protein
LIIQQFPAKIEDILPLPEIPFTDFFSTGLLLIFLHGKDISTVTIECETDHTPSVSA